MPTATPLTIISQIEQPPPGFLHDANNSFDLVNVLLTFSNNQQFMMKNLIRPSTQPTVPSLIDWEVVTDGVLVSAINSLNDSVMAIGPQSLIIEASEPMPG